MATMSMRLVIFATRRMTTSVVRWSSRWLVGTRTFTTEVSPRENPPEGQGAIGVRIADVSRAAIVIDEVPEGSAAAAAGFESGDRIVVIGDLEVTDSISYEFAIKRYLGDTVDATIERNNEVVVVPLTLPSEIADDDQTLGATVLAEIQFERPSIIRVLPMAVRQFFEYLQLMFEGLIMLLNGEVPLSTVAGPIGMGQLTSEIVEESAVSSWVAVMTITIVLSLNLAILNLAAPARRSMVGA